MLDGLHSGSDAVGVVPSFPENILAQILQRHDSSSSWTSEHVNIELNEIPSFTA